MQSNESKKLEAYIEGMYKAGSDHGIPKQMIDIIIKKAILSTYNVSATDSRKHPKLADILKKLNK